jgi:hypothetical protein
MLCEFCKLDFIPKSDKQKYCSQKCYNLSKRKLKIDPKLLKRLVWEKPTVQIAKEYGVSDKAVDKRCKLLNIAKPPRGYWAIIQSIKDLDE